MFCAKCRLNVSDEDIIGENEIGYLSRLPGAHHILCEICLDNEEAELCLGGKEALAELLESYGPSNALFAVVD